MKEEGIAVDNYAEYLTNLDSINSKTLSFPGQPFNPP